MHQYSRENTLVAINLFDHNTCLASQYPRNKASGFCHTHLNTLNSDHFIYGRVLDKLQQSYTQLIYPGWGGGGVSGFLCLLDLIFKSDCNFIPDAIKEREFI